jgi:anti-sigma regulatory factor (Ser/Thr protein kinase)
MTGIGNTSPPIDRPGGPVELRLPAEPELTSMVRLAASGLASITAFTIDEIEDIKIAVTEVMISLIEHGDGDHLSIEFSIDDDRFTVRGCTPASSFDPDNADLQLSRTVLAEVGSAHGMRSIDGRAEIWATVSRSV